MSTPSTMTNRTPATQINDVSPNGSQVTIPWDTWCKSFRERPNISSKDIQIEIAIREEAQKKLWKNHPVCRCFDRSVQKSKALMERLLWRVEVTVHGARKCLRKQRARVSSPKKQLKWTGKDSTTTLASSRETLLPARLSDVDDAQDDSNESEEGKEPRTRQLESPAPSPSGPSDPNDSDSTVEGPPIDKPSPSTPTRQGFNAN